MLIPLLWISLLAEPQVVAATLEAELVKARAQIKVLREQRRDETFLLNHPLALPELAVWSGTIWQSPNPAESLALRGRPGQVRIVHIWADWCGPCKEEFPRLKRMMDQLRADYQQDVQFILTSTTTDPERMQKFWTENSAAMPVGAQYGDTSGKLANSILQILPQGLQAIAPPGQHEPGRVPPLPMTLVLDDQNIVRLAFVGSLEGRHGALVSGIGQVYKDLSGSPPPSRHITRKLVAGRPSAKQ